MKVQIIFIMALILCCSSAKVNYNDGCHWKNNSGVTYDLSSLKKSQQWEVKEDLTGMGVFNMVYIFNFCTTTPFTCNGQQTAVYEALEVYNEMTQNCDNIARNLSPEFSNIDNDVKKGLQVVYTGGDACFSDFSNVDASSQNAKSRKATFLFECSHHNEDTFKVDTTDPCNTIFRMKSQVGCKGGMASSHHNFHLLLLIIFVFGVYFSVGYFLNKKQRDLTGIEALPHIELWRELPQLSLEGVRFSLNIGTKYSKKLIAKIKKSTGGEGEGADMEGYQTL